MQSESLKEERAQAAGVALLLAGLVAWLLREADGERLLGRQGTDALRALWGLDVLGRSILPPDLPFWTRELNPPAGALGLLLPWVSGLLAAPLVWLFAPVTAYNLFVGLLLWAAGLGTALLARTASGCWSAGAVAGAAVLAQPMLLWSVSDGTAEHVAIWGLPVFLAAALTATQRASPRWGLIAGGMAAVVALDSPYHAVYAALLGICALPLELRGRSPSDRTSLRATLAVFLGCLLALGALLGLLHLILPVGSGGGLEAGELQAINTANLESWARAERGSLPAEGPAPTAIPRALLLGALALSLIAWRRALPWALAAGLALALSFGTDPRLPGALAERLGAPGELLGQATLAINQQLYQLPGLSAIRFPYRWLVPAALAASVAGALGLARLFGPLARLPGARAGVAVAGSALVFSLCLRAGPFARGLPGQTLPQVAFADWIQAQPEDGVVALLPVLRPAAPGLGRNDRPVFAGLDPAMAGLDMATLQVLHGRAQVGAPGLQTLRPLDQESAVARVLRDWDDLTHPRLTGNPIPPGANDPRADRARGQGLDRLVEAGLRWVAVDLGAYEAEGLAELRRQLQPWVVSERTFDEGDGVLLLTVAARGGAE